MNLLPVRRVTLSSELPADALAERLREVIGSRPGAPFSGSVASDGFVITRVGAFRSASMPRARGRFVAQPGGGTRVRLRLRPPPIVFVFMGIWLAFLAAVAALIVGARVLDPGRGLLPLLAPAGLAAFSWFLMASVFAAEARWALDHMLEVVPALRRAGPPASPGTHSPHGASIVRTLR